MRQAVKVKKSVGNDARGMAYELADGQGSLVVKVKILLPVCYGFDGESTSLDSIYDSIAVHYYLAKGFIIDFRNYAADARITRETSRSLENPTNNDPCVMSRVASDVVRYLLEVLDCIVGPNHSVSH